MSDIDVTFDASNGRIVIEDEYVIDLSIEDFGGEADTYVGEFSADYPVKGVEAWYNEDVNCVLDVSWHKKGDSND